MITQYLWKTRLRSWALVAAASMLCMLASHAAWAQLNVEHKTVITFDAPFEVSGSSPQVLPAGKYTFKVVNSVANPNIVQVSNEAEDHVYTTILAVPIQREVETDKTVMMFEERPGGEPQALRAWFYPHEKTGQEFVYSKSRATELAKSSKTPVPYSESAGIGPATGSSQTTNPSPVLSMPPSESAQAAALTRQAPPTELAPVQTQTPAPQTPAQPVQPTPAQAEPQIASNLPSTASKLPLLAVFGCLFIIAGISIKKLCER